MTTSQALFDTRIDTKKIFVTIKVKFVLRNYINSSGKSPLYIFITSPGDRKRPKADLEFPPNDWDPITQRLKPEAYDAQAYNIIIDNIVSKITKIKTTYLLSEKTLTATKLEEELKNTTERVHFKTFFKKQLELEKNMMAKGYYKRVKSVLNKLEKYPKELLFCDIGYDFEKNYRIYLSSIGNKTTTINSNLATIKKYLITAKKAGIKTPLDPPDLKVGRTHGNRLDLKPNELSRFYKYYFSDFIPEYWKLILGYFLFSCFTSIRWGNIIDQDRSTIIDQRLIRFYVQKTNKRQSLAVNDSALKIVQHNPKLFVERVTDVHINRELKKISKQLGFTEKLTFHVARHTFATNFIRMGGNIVKLKTIMGHSKIETTMIYVHIVEQEAHDEMALLDGLF